MKRNWHEIIKDKTDQLIYLIERINLEYPEKAKLSKNDLIEYLQNTCSEIHVALNSVFVYIMETKLDPPVFEILKRKCKILIEKAKLLEIELISYGSSLEDFYIDVDYLLADKNILNKNKLQYSELIEYTSQVSNSFNSNSTLPQNEIAQKESMPKKHSQKWFALLYWIELKANNEKPPINNDGSFIKSKIEEIGAKKTNSKGQSFYRNFIEIELKTEILKKSFGLDWKKIIIDISQNSPIIVNYLENNFN